ncbi:MAG: amidohydrolase family protein [Gemmatimonadales bacterium]|nr:amidohydrolase family protein [Gemmatimonadales bacterium]
MRSRRTIVALSLLALGAGQAVGQRAADWSVAQPRGKTRVIDFTVDQGTYLSVDLAPDGRWLVFDLLGHIYRLPVEGGTAENLTAASGIALNYHPRISPDGREIAFVSDRGGQDNLWVMGADGSNPRQLLADDDSRAAEPAWTPDGQAILISRKMKSPSGFYRTNDEIWQFPRAGGPGKVLVKLPPSASSVPARAGVWAGQDRAQWPSMSPDGRFVYFHSSLFSGADRRLRRLEVGSGRIDDVTETKDRYLTCCGRTTYPARLGEIAPEVSPDGRWLAFARKIPGAKTSYRGHEYIGRTALWLRDLTTGVDRVVMDPITNDAMDLHPAWDHRVLPGYSWARDGKSIVITQGGRIRRLWVETGRVETIPFQARVRREISEMARHQGSIDDRGFRPRAIRWPASSPDGARLVFEAAGRLWLRSLPDGPVAPLLTTSPGGFELTPTWTPDGGSVVFATWSDDEGGAVWRVRPGGTPERISRTPGRYLYPRLAPDGRTVVVNRWSPALKYLPNGTGWELVTLDGAGQAAVVRGPGPLVEAASDTAGLEYRVRGTTLVATRASARNPWVHPVIAGAVAVVAPSPDGRWLAIQQKHDVFLAPLPPVAVGESLTVSLADDAPSLRRLTRHGGMFPRWRNASTLELVSANRYLSYDVSRQRVDSVALDFEIPRDRGLGTVALTGARIITLDQRRVIERGTIVVKDGRIACVGVCSLAGVSQRIDATGKTTMPGWVDVHAHHTNDEGDGMIPERRASSARYLAWGVTTTHDPASEEHVSFPLSELIEAGRVVGPRTYSTGVPLTCSDFDDLREIDSYQEALDHIRREANLGALSIKDYRQCTRIQRQMLAEAARAVGVTITSEGSDPLYLAGLIMNGSTGWEHPIQYHPLYADYTRFFGQAGAHYSAQLFISDYPHGAAIDHWLGQEDLWANAKVREWTPWAELALRRGLTKKPLSEFIFPILAEGAADIKRSGGYLAVGAHGEQDGLGTHWEVWSYAQALSPMEALEAASLDGAHFLGLERELGSLAPGKLADLVVLNANPLADIRKTTDIRYVMKAGRLYDARTMDEVWPRKKPYGRKPWNQNEMHRVDVRPDEFWDRPGGR